MTRVLRLESLHVRTFRNIPQVDLELHPRFNVLEGDNGQGKSSLLEAICLVGWQRSFRGARIEEMIQLGAERASIQARLRLEGQPVHEVAIELRPGTRVIRLDGKRAPRPELYFAMIQMVLFHPGELDLVQGGPASRRMLLDRVLYQTASTYPAFHRDHQKALKSRNKLLREGASAALIQAFDRPLAEAAVQIVQARRSLVEELAPSAARAFAEITGGGLPLVMQYRPRSEALRVEDVLNELQRALPRDLARGSTSVGPQSDELELLLAGSPARSFGSQGQQRALVLAIKCAEVEVVRTRCHQLPILLLDDVSSELDPTRSRYLFETLQAGGGQVVMTTTNAAFIPLRDECRVTRVSRGGVLG